MTEKELADKFAADLERKLAGAKRPEADPMLKVADMLSGTDFSSESRIRAGLRARLLAKGERRTESFWSRLREAIVSPHPAWAAGAACVLMLVVAGLLHQPSAIFQDAVRDNEMAALPPGLPVTGKADDKIGMEPAVQAQKALPRVTGLSSPKRTEDGIFESHPAVPLISTREITPAMLSEKMTGDSAIRSVPGQLKGGEDGESISWDTDDGTLILERRVITVDTIFERRTI